MIDRHNLNLKVITMTIKKSAVKAVKPTTKAIAFNPVLAAKHAAECSAQAGTFSAQADKLAKDIHNHCKKTGVKVGTMKSDCVIMSAFVSVAEKKLSGKSLENECSRFRKACNEGEPFSHNRTRDAKKRGAKTSKSAESASVVRLTIVKDSDISEVAQGLREVFEGKREQYAELVAFLIDAIDEFEGV